jgi:hypothetical protein
MAIVCSYDWFRSPSVGDQGNDTTVYSYLHWMKSLDKEGFCIAQGVLRAPKYAQPSVRQQKKACAARPWISPPAPETWDRLPAIRQTYSQMIRYCFGGQWWL